MALPQCIRERGSRPRGCSGIDGSEHLHRVKIIHLAPRGAHLVVEGMPRGTFAHKRPSNARMVDAGGFEPAWTGSAMARQTVKALCCVEPIERLPQREFVIVSALAQPAAADNGGAQAEIEVNLKLELGRREAHSGNREAHILTVLAREAAAVAKVCAVGRTALLPGEASHTMVVAESECVQK